MERQHNKLYVFLIYASLTLATFVAFGKLQNNDFTNYDDNVYVTKNPHVTGGITYESIVWAFTRLYGANWHPLTWLSHMLDCQLFRLNASGHHLTSLVLHVASTLLLFWAFRRMTGAVWRSAFVAAVFALHPLHVESVAWVAERKDVLSGLFWMLTIVAYIRYAEKPRIRRYLLVVLSLTLGLMAKPMVVTLPFVLLLLDYWPLDRLQWPHQCGKEVLPQPKSVDADHNRFSAARLIVEKIPLFTLVAASSIVTYIAQQSGHMVVHVPLKARVIHVADSYIGYIMKMAYPSRLAVLYPYPTELHLDYMLLLIGISALILWRAKQLRWLTVGWLWYLGTLVPVIGLVQVGDQAMADRYSYLPSIGIFIIVAWGAPELLAKWHYRKIALSAAAAVALVALLICTRMQVSHWKNSSVLFGHTLEVTENNFVIHNGYGVALARNGQMNEAIEHYKKALQIQPEYADAYANLGATLSNQGKFDEAVVCYNRALSIKPNLVLTHSNLGDILLGQNKLDEAVEHFIEALRIKPSCANAEEGLRKALNLAVSKGREDLAKKIRKHLNINIYESSQPHYRP
jgi:tetratricopeptide (TPR) repeat protein